MQRTFATREQRYLQHILCLLGLAICLHILNYIVSLSCAPVSISPVLLEGKAQPDAGIVNPGAQRRRLGLRSALSSCSPCNGPSASRPALGGSSRAVDRLCRLPAPLALCRLS